MAAPTIFCELDLGPNGLLRFDTPSALVEFGQFHRAHYNWLAKCRLPNPNIVQNLLGQLDAAANAARQWANDPAQQANGSDRLRTVFAVHAIPIQGTPRFEFIEELRARRGDQVAAYALATLGGWVGDFSPFAAISGAFEIASFDAGISSHTLLPEKKALEKSRDTMRSATHRAKEAEREREEEFQRLREKDKRRIDITRRWDLRRIVRLVAKSQKETAAAVADIKLVEKQYTELMKLKAPVDYWKDKAKEHETRALEYRSAVKRAAIWGGLCVFVVLAGITIAVLKLTTPQTHLAVFATLAAFGALTTTGVLWLVRILVRLFLSQHHLALDAHERATMALTYLALTGEGKAEEKDRTLVLTSLFRPTSDGIVKDDAAPEIGLANVISKALAK